MAENNGRITTPFAADETMPFVHLNKCCLDLHPDIDGYINSLAAVTPATRAQPYYSTRRDFTNCYHLCWTVMESTCVLSRGGVDSQGPDSIISAPNLLPEGVELVQDASAIMVMMGLTGIENFGADRYKCLEF